MTELSSQFYSLAKNQVSPKEAEENRLKHGIRIHSVEPFEDFSDSGGNQPSDVDEHGQPHQYGHIIATVPHPDGTRKTIGRISYVTSQSNDLGSFRGVEVHPDYAHLGVHHILFKAANELLKQGFGESLKPGRQLHMYNAGDIGSSIMNSLTNEDAICSSCSGDGCSKCDETGYETEKSKPFEKWLGWKVPTAVSQTPQDKLIKVNVKGAQVIKGELPGPVTDPKLLNHFKGEK